MKPALAPSPAPDGAKAPPLKLVVVGHVDHGKSTLVGRLLHDTGSLPEGKKAEIEKSCKARGMDFEWAFLLDALQAERDQNVTIDTTRIVLRGKNMSGRKGRDTVIIDAPGHVEFLSNMITGAAEADAALLVVDAKEGVCEQSRRHALLLELLGVKQAAVVVNKMDAIGFDATRFRAIERDYGDYLKELGIEVRDFIPVCARDGDNVGEPSARMAWHKGKTVLQSLDDFRTPAPDAARPLRFPVQDVYKTGDKRILAGRVESGTLRVGDDLLFSPADTAAKIASIEAWNSKTPPAQAAAGQSVGITLDRPVFVERGQVASHQSDAPPITNLFRARLFWLEKTPLKAGDRLTLKTGTMEIPAEIRTVSKVVDAGTLGAVSPDAVGYGMAAEAVIRTRGQIAADPGARLVLAREGAICGGGVVREEGLHDQRLGRVGAVKSQNLTTVEFGITAADRAARNGHSGGVIWLTGLSGAGKSTIATLAQKKLFDLGAQVFVLDGDNVRQGLCRDLGFSHEDRSENIRRVAEVAALFAQSGVIVITAFISPYGEDRRLARAVAPDDFHLVHVRASVGTCERRDVKGLYQKARRGEISHFTGVSAPYEEPETPDLVLDTEQASAEACAEALVAYVAGHLVSSGAWKNSDSD